MKKILIKAAKEAGKLLLDNFQTEKAQTVLEQKNPFDYSTLMDKIAEDKILEILKENGIQGKVVTEEAGIVNLGDSDYTFFIDPLDGTINYSYGIPMFCTSIGVKKGNERAFGVVYYPDKDELFFAEKGKGSFLNDKKLQVSNKSDLANSSFEFGMIRNELNHGLETFKKLIQVTRLRNSWCAALATSFIACRRVDGVFFRGQKSWDMMAACLIVEEAGGVVTDFNGKKWDENSESTVAANPILHEKIMNLLRN